MRKILFSTLLFYFICTGHLHTQNLNSYYPNKNIFYKSADSLILFPDNFIISNTLYLKTTYDSAFIKNNFEIDYDMKIFLFKSRMDSIYINYQYVPFSWELNHYRRKPIFLSDSNYKVSAVPKSNISFSSSSDIFGNSLQKSGGLIRSFSVGSNKDLTLNSGFKLQLSGNITDDILITASMTDEASPLLPEGNTQTIKEIDKVFINVAHSTFDITLGDFVYENSTLFLGNISRKLQGGKGSYIMDNHKIDMLYGSPPGKFNIQQITVMDGVQGPYKLVSESGSPSILVIPNSEKVFMDGRLLTRGESEDYTIDYSIGEVLFMIKNLIKSNSRISIEFEYNDQKYERTFFGLNTSGLIFNKLNYSVSYFQEGDDNSSPISFMMNEENKLLLQQAGNDTRKAYNSSIIYVGRDSITLNGLGQYSKIDTIIDGVQYSYYNYCPGTKGAEYSVNFSYVGDNKGDYNRESYAVFKWVGVGQGNYLPVHLYPLPELKRYANFTLNYGSEQDFLLSNEFSISNHDINTLSDIGGKGEGGFGVNTKLNYNLNLIDLFDKDFGICKIELYNYYVSDKFISPSRNREIDYAYKWNTVDDVSKKHIYEMGIDYFPIKSMQFKYNYGQNNYGLNSNAQKHDFSYILSDSVLPKLNFSMTDIANQELTFNSHFKNINITPSYEFNKFKIRLGLLNEIKETHHNSVDSLLDGYDIKSMNFNFDYTFSKQTSLQYELEYRTDGMPDSNELKNVSSRIINKLNFYYSTRNTFFSQITGGFQKINYSEIFKKRLGNNLNLFVKSLLRYNNEKRSLESNLFYESSSQYSAKNQKVYLRVEKGKGSHIYIGDINNNNIADENEFQQVKYDGDYIPITVKTDQLQPVTDLKTSFRLKLNPSREIKRATTIYEHIISNISTESNVQINEVNNTSENQDIYLLKLSNFLNDSNTISGSQSYLQDIFLFEKSDLINLRLRYNERKSLTQYTYGIEKRDLIERSVRFRFIFHNNITNETTVSSANDNSLSKGNEERNYFIRENDLSSSFSYRPIQDLEFVFGLSFGKKEELIEKVVSNYNTQSVAFNLAMMNAGNLHFNLERNEIILSKTIGVIPYNLTDGKLAGISWVMNSNFSYKINSYAISSFNYLGRKGENAKLINTFTLEIRLVF
jgi:hypothetical protein